MIIYKKEKMNLETTIQLDPELLYSKIGDEIVLLTIESGKYFKVDAVGSRIWEIIKESTSIQILLNQLVEEYDVSFEECQKDVLSFIEKLQQDNLILLS